MKMKFRRRMQLVLQSTARVKDIQKPLKDLLPMHQKQQQVYIWVIIRRTSNGQPIAKKELYTKVTKNGLVPEIISLIAKLQLLHKNSVGHQQF